MRFILLVLMMVMSLSGCDDGGARKLPANELACTDGIDDDGDGALDCDDPDCATDEACLPVEDCVIAGDEDGDGVADCADPDCSAEPACVLGEDCGQAGDEDGDLVADCGDPECLGVPGPGGFTCEAPETTCGDGADNDGDGGADCVDADCAAAVPCTVQGELTVDFSFPAVERARGIYLWLETLDGTYVDTVQQYFGRGDAPTMRYDYLGYRFPNDPCVEWQAAVGETDTLVLDGVTTATPLGVSAMGDYTSERWDCRDRAGAPIAKASYVVRVEMTFDGTGHPLLPVHYYRAVIDLSGGSVSVPFEVTDEKVSAGTVHFSVAGN